MWSTRLAGFPGYGATRTPIVGWLVHVTPSSSVVAMMSLLSPNPEATGAGGVDR